MSNSENDKLIENFTERFHELKAVKDWQELDKLGIEMMKLDLAELETALNLTLTLDEHKEYKRWRDKKVDEEFDRDIKAAMDDDSASGRNSWDEPKYIH